MLPPANDTASRLKRFGAICIGAGIIATTLLTLATPSTSRMQVWPWSLLTLFTWATWILAGCCALAAHGRLTASLTGAGLAILGLVCVLSAFSSFLPGVSKPATLPVLAGCMAPFAFHSVMAGERRRHWLAWLGLFSGIVTAVSFYLWIITRVGPAFAEGQSFTDALKARNDQPFGHSNYVAAFSLLAIGTMGACLARASHRWERNAWSAGIIAGLGVLFSTGSRAGLVALVAGIAAFGFMALRAGCRIPRKHLLIAGLATALLVAAGVAANPRMRELVLHGRWGATAQESNQQRLGMSQAAVALGLERPVLGWGPGMVPQVFPSVRAAVAGNVDNVIQVHSSLLQTWATLGIPGTFAAVLIAAGFLTRVFRPSRMPSESGTTSGWISETAPLASGLVAFAAYSFFDHSLDIPAMALLAGAMLGATGFSPTAPTAPTSIGRAAASIALVLTLLLAPGIARDQLARQAYSEALASVIRRDQQGFREALIRADHLAPDSTYPSHVLASWLATGLPFGNEPPLADKGAAAIPVLEASLTRNPFLEYAHYNLGWLYLESRPETAEKHFLAASLLAPHRIGVHTGLALARMARENPAGAAAAFAAERVNDPRQAFEPLFREPALSDIASRTDTLARNFLRAQARAGHIDGRRADAVLAAWSDTSLHNIPTGQPLRRVRPGYGVLMGFPEGRPPADVNLMASPGLPPAINASLPKPGWVNGELLLKLALGEAPPTSP
ncbi:MAG: O-antigen ligase family protein [Opitutaceae bacterium]|nr:O-antigen ligase family protein [Opitutaceae bacterium]